MMQPQGQPQVVYVTQPVSAPISYKYNVHRSSIRVTAILQLVAGISSFLLNIIFLILAASTLRYGYAYLYGYGYIYGYGAIGTGFWCGIPFIITGSIGIPAGNGNRCLVIGYLVMSIISAVLAAPCLIVWGLAIGIYSGAFAYIPGPAAMIVFSLLVAIMEFGAAIAASVFCCKGMGSTAAPTVPAQNMQYMTTTTTTYGQPQPYPGQYGYPQGVVAAPTYPQGGAAPLAYPQGVVVQPAYPQGVVAAPAYPQGGAPPQGNPQAAPDPYPQKI